MVEPEVARARRLAQAHLTGFGLTDLDRCQVQNLGTASVPNLNRMRHRVSTNAQTPCTFNGERTIPQVHYSHNDVAVYARFCYSLGSTFARSKTWQHPDRRREFMNSSRRI